MPKQLPETTNFLKQAERNVTLEGTMPLVKLERLSEILCGNEGELFAKLHFTSDTGYLGLHGRVEASLELDCQRCMQPMEHKVSGQINFGLMTSEKYEDKLPPDVDPYLLEGDEQSLVEILEDELLLSIPIAAVHQKECSEFLLRQNEERRVEKEKSNPFAVLKDLKID
ncbi:MAG: YceD family protein [Gammaproteobacteria bacterium]|nr:YceD family protein [Gammaproteobacteria bacterium]MCW8922600.1 YceD family protein [Gammaproteobacteria bacterium]